MERFEMSVEALIAMSILLDGNRACEEILGEECIILYGTDRSRLKSLDELDAAQLLEIVRSAEERLEAFRLTESICRQAITGGTGCSTKDSTGHCDTESWEVCGRAESSGVSVPRGGTGSCRTVQGGEQDETIRITRDLRIMLPERGGEEIRMRPMTKSVFLLFLRHPEGIRFKEIGDYEEELAGFYSKLSRHTDLEHIEASLRRVLGQEDCTLSIAASRLTSKMKSVFGNGLWEKYSIRGAAGEAKTISLDRKYVIWE